MSIFSKIKDAIFGHKAAPAPEDRPQIPAGICGRSSGAGAALRPKIASLILLKMLMIQASRPCLIWLI